MKLIRSAIALMLAAFAASFASFAFAGTIEPYDQATFDKLAAAGKPIVLSVRAPWCPTCKAQDPIQSSLMKTPAYQDYTILTIDFDSQKDLLKKYAVAMQSTIIAFHGKTEVGRSVGDTKEASIDALMKKAAG